MPRKELRARLADAKAKLAALEQIQNPDHWQQGSMEYERGRVKHLKLLLRPAGKQSEEAR